MLIAQPSFSCAPEEGVLGSYQVTEYYWNTVPSLTAWTLYTRQPSTQPYFLIRIGACIENKYPYVNITISFTIQVNLIIRIYRQFTVLNKLQLESDQMASRMMGDYHVRF